MEIGKWARWLFFDFFKAEKWSAYFVERVGWGSFAEWVVVGMMVAGPGGGGCGRRVVFGGRRRLGLGKGFQSHTTQAQFSFRLNKDSRDSTRTKMTQTMVIECSNKRKDSIEDEQTEMVVN